MTMAGCCVKDEQMKQGPWLGCSLISRWCWHPLRLDFIIYAVVEKIIRPTFWLSGCGSQDKQGKLFSLWRVSFVVDGISGMKQFGHLPMSPTDADQRQGSIQVIRLRIQQRCSRRWWTKNCYSSWRSKAETIEDHWQVTFLEALYLQALYLQAL